MSRLLPLAALGGVGVGAWLHHLFIGSSTPKQDIIIRESYAPINVEKVGNKITTVLDGHVSSEVHTS